MSEEYANAEPAQKEEWPRQNSLIYGALIAVGLVFVQPYLTVPPPSLSAKVCVVAFAVAIPLLAALVLVNRQEAFRRRAASSRLVGFGKGAAQLGAITGIVAGFWHISWIAGVVMLASGGLGLIVHGSGYLSIEGSRIARFRKRSAGQQE